MPHARQVQAVGRTPVLLWWQPAASGRVGSDTVCAAFLACSSADRCVSLWSSCVVLCVVLQVSQVVGRGFASLFNSYSGLPSSLEVRQAVRSSLRCCCFSSLGGTSLFLGTVADLPGRCRLTPLPWPSAAPPCWHCPSVCVHPNRSSATSWPWLSGSKALQPYGQCSAGPLCRRTPPHTRSQPTTSQSRHRQQPSWPSGTSGARPG